MNWKSIEPRSISKNSLWVKCQGDSLVTAEMLTELSANFSTKSTPTELCTKPPKNDFKVLDRKSVQNILIFKRVFLKNISNSQITQAILECDISMNVVEGLIQCLPQTDQLKQLHDLKDTIELSEAEEFVASLSTIRALMPRLRSIRFKHSFAEMVKDLEPNMIATIRACEEIKANDKFAKIVEMILTIGNYMNSGSTSTSAFGFEISFLTKIIDTKDSANKRTLLHYLVNMVKSKYPDLLSFGDGIPHIEVYGSFRKDSK